jgi:hypothetical protein
MDSVPSPFEALMVWTVVGGLGLALAYLILGPPFRVGDDDDA